MMPKKILIPFFLIFIFLMPIAGGHLLYYFHDYFTLKPKNKGTLISPPLHANKNKTKKWEIIYVCEKNCAAVEFDLSQLKKLLNTDSNRVTISIQNRNKSISEWGGSPVIQSQRIYLMDPLNNVFMYYPDSENPLHILKDLKQVLEVSSIG